VINTQEIFPQVHTTERQAILSVRQSKTANRQFIPGSLDQRGLQIVSGISGKTKKIFQRVSSGSLEMVIQIITQIMEKSWNKKYQRRHKAVLPACLFLCCKSGFCFAFSFV
jgi:hypothetical protein